MKKKTVLAGAMAVALTLSQFFGTAALAETVDTTEGSVTKDITKTITDGLEVYAEGGKSATVTAKDVSNDEGADGVHAEASGSGSSVDVTVNGSVNGGYDDIIEAAAAGGGQTSVTVNGDASGSYGVYVHDSTDNENEYGNGTINVTVNGKITGEDYGIDASANENSTVTVTAKGNVTGASEDGVEVEAGENSTSTIKVSGNINGGSSGIDADSYGRGNTTVEVTGDVTGGNNGIYAEASYGGNTSVLVNGNVSATGSASSEEDYYRERQTVGIYLDIDGGDVTVSVKDKDDPNDSDISGNVRSTGAGLHISYVPDNDNEEGTLTAEADDQTGAAASSGSADVLIEGVLHGDTAAVMVSENVTPDDLKLTVWKVDPVNDNIVEFAPEYTEPEFRPLSVQLQSITLTNEGTNTADTGAASSDADKETKRQALEKSIQYIIKVEQPKEGATLTATGKGGAALAVSHDHSVAKEGEEVYLKVDLQKGFKITGAFNGLGQKVALLKDASGNYYVTVPKGGGVYLTAELEKVQEEKKEEKKTGSSGSRSGSGNTRMGYWKQDAHGWYYQFVNGGGIARNTVFYIDQKSSDGYTPGYYGFGEDGYMKTGWALINNYWYYFDPASGLMMYGWQNINGKDYYLNPGVLATGTFAIPIGALYMNTVTPDGCKVDASGARG